MKKMNLIISTLITLVLITGITLYAKGDKGHGKRGKCGNERPKMTQEMADQLNQLKSDFDSKLSEEDLNSLNLLREKVKSEMLDIKTQISEIKNSDISKEEKKTKIHELMKDNKGNKDEVKSVLKAILEDNKEAVESLASSLKELKQNDGHPKRREQLKDNKNEEHKGHRIARFILHDDFVAIKEEFREKVKDSKKLDLVVNNDQLTFVSPDESSNSKFTLYDLNGNKITNIANQNIIKGENSINLNTLNMKLEKGRYFLIIENENGVSSGKFIYLK
ncbi:MAG: hypothetical protein CVV25_08715 [Ignavibacteriae bacterium HGW-Ignavibacteriae-4]|jgi:hypothetical protein|nr:MAG: hypothetical protein CVV25_08715 [Ignavibacteriae bacterium HGW-Ignavibacteriae-4]